MRATRWRRRALLLGMWLAAAGCTYDTSHGSLRCGQEGQRDGDRTCLGGFWVTAATTADMNPTLPPADMMIDMAPPPPVDMPPDLPGPVDMPPPSEDEEMGCEPGAAFTAPRSVSLTHPPSPDDMAGADMGNSTADMGAAADMASSTADMGHGGPSPGPSCQELGVVCGLVEVRDRCTEETIEIDCGYCFVELAAGTEHTCALSRRGHLLCWGSNEYGQLGDGTTDSPTGPRLALDAHGRPLIVEPATRRLGARQMSVAAGHAQTCAFLRPWSDGSGGGWHCWGDNDRGALGIGEADAGPFLTPRPLAGGLGLEVLSLSRSSARDRIHGCGVVDHELYCWGRDSNGSLGLGQPGDIDAPQRVEIAGLGPSVELGDVTTFDRGGCVTTLVGDAVFCWGREQAGRLGLPGDDQLRPLELQGLDARRIAMGAEHTCAIRAAASGALVDGLVLCWGAPNRVGIAQPGQEDWETPDLGQPVEGLAAARGIVAGEGHTCALSAADGRVTCWGLDDDGALGNGPDGGSRVPISPGGLVGVDALVAGRGHTCALETGGATRIWCWGDNLGRQIRATAPDDVETPLELTPLPVLKASP